MTLLLATLSFLCIPSANADWDVDINPFDGDGLSVVDCKSPPNAQRPDSGVYGWLDPGKPTARSLIPPAERKPITVKGPNGGNITIPGPTERSPFEKNAKVSIYEMYGYAGLTVHQYDRGDIKGCLPNWNPAVAGSNLMAWVAKVGQALTIRLYSWIFSGLGAMQSFQDFSARATGYALLLPFLAIALAATGIYFLWRSRHADVAEATGKSIGAAGIVGLGILATIYPIAIGSAVDHGMGSVMTGVSDQVSAQRAEEPSQPVDAATSIAANLHESILWPAWQQSWFGRENTAAAEKYGPSLFQSMAYTRREAAYLTAHPDKAESMSKAKSESFKRVAGQVKKEFPAAYQYVAGKQTNDQAGTWFVTMVGSLAAGVPFLIALARFLYAMVVVRIGVAIAPAVALVSQFPRFQHKAVDLVKLMIAAVVTAVAFGAYSIIYVVVGVGTVMSPQTGWHPMMKVAVIIAMNFAAWLMARKLGITSSGKLRKRLSNLRRNGRSESNSTPEPTIDNGREWEPPTPAPKPQPQPKREAGLVTRTLKQSGKGALQGAASTAVLGVLTGGTVTAGAMAAGAAKGAGVAMFMPQKKNQGGTSAGQPLALPQPASAPALPPGTSSQDRPKAQGGLKALPAAQPTKARSAAFRPSSARTSSTNAAPAVVEPSRIYQPGERMAARPKPAESVVEHGQVVHRIYRPEGASL